MKKTFPIRGFFRGLLAAAVFLISPYVTGSQPLQVQQNPLGTLIPQDETLPSFFVEMGGESFYKYGLDSKKGILGLSAIMIDAGGNISPRLSFFSAFHFDSSPWQDLINHPMGERESEPQLELAVEEFFMNWLAIPEILTVSAGRRFSRISYANQLHLSDFQFNMKPRVFTEYFGENHGLALDGIRLKYHPQIGAVQASLQGEAAKGGYASEQLVLTAILDLGWQRGSFDFGWRAFGYFDHQENNHPLMKYLPADKDLSFLQQGLDLNAWGAGLNIVWAPMEAPRAFFQAEWFNRSFSDQNLKGGYAMAEWVHSPMISSIYMVQQLQIPDFSPTQMNTLTEKALTLGISVKPIESHRINFEYSQFSNSSFYNKMLLAKWSFMVNL